MTDQSGSILIGNLSALAQQTWYDWFAAEFEAQEPGWQIWDSPTVVGLADLPAEQRVVLIYTPARSAIEKALMAGQSPSEALAAWEIEATAQLAQHKKRRRRTYLLPAPALTDNPGALKVHLSAWTGMTPTKTAPRACMPQADITPSVMQLLALQTAEASPSAKRLSDALMAAGFALPASIPTLAQLDSVHAFLANAGKNHDWQQAKIYQLSSDLLIAEERLGCAVEENTTVRGKLAAVQTASAATAAELERLRLDSAQRTHALEQQVAALSEQRLETAQRISMLEVERHQLITDLRNKQADLAETSQQAAAIEQQRQAIQSCADTLEVEREKALEALDLLFTNFPAAPHAGHNRLNDRALLAELERLGALIAEEAAHKQQLEQKVLIFESRNRPYLQRKIAEQDSAIERLKLRRNTLRTELLQLKSILSDREQSLVALSEERRFLEMDLYEHRGMIREFHNSTSWRVTAPLRATRRIFSRSQGPA